MPIKTLGSLGKIRVGRVTGNTHIFLGLTKVNRLKVPDGTLTTNDRETANVLNEFFACVFEKEGDGDLPFFPEQQYAEELSTIYMSSENVKKCRST